MDNDLTTEELDCPDCEGQGYVCNCDPEGCETCFCSDYPCEACDGSGKDEETDHG